MKLKSIGLGLCIISSIVASSAFAARTTYFHNNSNYDLRIWEMDCTIGMDNSQTCSPEYYGGYVAAHSTLKMTNNASNGWRLAGPRVTRATVQNTLNVRDPKALITDLPICTDIHEDYVDGALTFNVVSNAVTCADSTDIHS
jgi:hypothetical protein